MKGKAGAGTLELKMSSAISQEPSDWRFQTSTYLPLSRWVSAPGGVNDIS